MGYTHYWRIKKPPTLPDMEKIICDLNADLKYFLNAFKESFVSIIPMPTDNTFSIFNLKVECFEKPFWPLSPLCTNGRRFCTTNGTNPMDAIVIGCLALMKHHLGSGIDVSSDGTREEWVYQLEKYEQWLPKHIKCPSLVEDDGKDEKDKENVAVIGRNFKVEISKDITLDVSNQFDHKLCPPETVETKLIKDGKVFYEELAGYGCDDVCRFNTRASLDEEIERVRKYFALFQKPLFYDG